MLRLVRSGSYTFVHVRDSTVIGRGIPTCSADWRRIMCMVGIPASSARRLNVSRPSERVVVREESLARLNKRVPSSSAVFY